MHIGLQNDRIWRNKQTTKWLDVHLESYYFLTKLMGPTQQKMMTVPNPGAKEWPYLKRKHIKKNIPKITLTTSTSPDKKKDIKTTTKWDPPLHPEKTYKKGSSHDPPFNPARCPKKCKALTLVRSFRGGLPIADTTCFLLATHLWEGAWPVCIAKLCGSGSAKEKASSFSI